MRTFFVVLVALVVAPSLCAQQKAAKVKPEFSGNWALDRKKTSDHYLARDYILRTVHQDPEFRFVRSYQENGQTKLGQEFIYYTDGRGEKNQTTLALTTSPNPSKAPDQTSVTESKTVWRGDKIETRSRINGSVAGFSLNFERIEEWKLSEDGQTLTHKSRVEHRGGTAAFVPATPPETKLVYRRVN